MEPRKLMVIYTAGPFRPTEAGNMYETHQNIERAKLAALQIWRAGHVALCPHANTGLEFQGAAPDDVWLAGDLVLLERCDAILMLPGWEDSSGAKLEKAYAVDKGLSVFYTVPDAIAWADEQ